MPLVYALIDTADPHHYRYVGKTVWTAKRRMRWHVDHSRRVRKTIKDKWIGSVLDRGGHIDVVVVEDDVDGNLLDFRECMWIASFRESGHRLTNQTEGGTGGKTYSGYNPRSAEGNERVRQAVIDGWVRRGGMSEAQRNANRSSEWDDERRAAHSKAMMGRSLPTKGMKQDAERAAKSRIAALGKKQKSGKRRPFTDGRQCPVCHATFCWYPYNTSKVRVTCPSDDCKRTWISVQKTKSVVQ